MRMESLKEEMKEISKEHESIRNGQREVKEKFEMIELECEQLRRETDFITQQSLKTQLRLLSCVLNPKSTREQRLHQSCCPYSDSPVS
ncbi:hypothetical protein REPUB_Repub10bG0096200 [Reevesia pubescens]